jgi:hypothetical protein
VLEKRYCKKFNKPTAHTVTNFFQFGASHRHNNGHEGKSTLPPLTETNTPKSRSKSLLKGVGGEECSARFHDHCSRRLDDPNPEVRTLDRRVQLILVWLWPLRRPLNGERHYRLKDIPGGEGDAIPRPCARRLRRAVADHKRLPIFEKNRIILTLPSDASRSAGQRGS